MGEKMRWSEAEAVVRAYRTERGGSAEVDVATLARALGTTEADVLRLARPRRRFVDRSGLVSAGLAFGLATVAAIALVPTFLAKRPLVANRRETTAITIPGKRMVIIRAEESGRVHAIDLGGDAPAQIFAYPGGASLHLPPLGELPTGEKPL